jgi:DNA-binding CsgD family transcriptional regulator/PAS domain-containing protein
MKVPSDVEGLAGLFYEAVLEPEKWKLGLTGLRDLAGARAAALSRADLDVPSNTVIDEVGHAQEALAAYHDYYCRIDPLLLHANRLTVGHWWSDRAVLGRAHEASEFYTKYARTYDYHSRLAAPLWRNGADAAFITVQRSEQQGAFPAYAPEPLQQLLPHLTRAARLDFATRDLRAEASFAEQALNHVPAPVFVVQNDGRVLLCNEAAEALCRNSQVVVLNADKLQLREQPHRLLQALKDACTPGKTSPSWLRVTSARTGKEKMVVVAPLSSSSPCARPWQRPLAVVMVTRISGAPQGTSDVLRGVFGLTPAEARVAVQVAEGESLSDISDKFHVALGTVRGQLKAVYAKLGVSRQAELCRLLASLNAIAPPTQPGDRDESVF